MYFGLDVLDLFHGSRHDGLDSGEIAQWLCLYGPAADYHFSAWACFLIITGGGREKTSVRRAENRWWTLTWRTLRLDF